MNFHSTVTINTLQATNKNDSKLLDITNKLS